MKTLLFKIYITVLFYIYDTRIFYSFWHSLSNFTFWLMGDHSVLNSSNSLKKQYKRNTAKSTSDCINMHGFKECYLLNQWRDSAQTCRPQTKKRTKNFKTKCKILWPLKVWSSYDRPKAGRSSSGQRYRPTADWQSRPRAEIWSTVSEKLFEIR